MSTTDSRPDNEPAPLLALRSNEGLGGAAQMLPCLSILQPYAWLIVHGHKDIENRDWFTRFRGRILIHAGKKYSRRDHEEYAEEFDEEGITLPPFEQMQLGGIVGSATMTDCVRDHPSRWKILGSWGFVLKDQRVRPFVPYRGQLSIFSVPRTALVEAPPNVIAKQEPT